MSYTPTSWKRGDVITAEKLNNMESGIENANQNVYIATLSYDGSNYSCDKTPEQIKSAADGGAVVFLRYGDEYNMKYFPLSDAAFEDEYTTVTFTRLFISSPSQNQFTLYEEYVSIGTTGITFNTYMYNVSATRE